MNENQEVIINLLFAINSTPSGSLTNTTENNTNSQRSNAVHINKIIQPSRGRNSISEDP